MHHGQRQYFVFGGIVDNYRKENVASSCSPGQPPFLTRSGKRFRIFDATPLNEVRDPLGFRLAMVADRAAS
jgi:hypothetical protein